MRRKKKLSIKQLVWLSKKIEDPRRPWGNKRHELVDVLVIALMAIVCGSEGWEEICDYGQMKNDWLRTFLRLENGIPSESTFRRVFARILPTQLEEVYRKWVMPYVGSSCGKQICIDGKSVRGAKRADSMLHMVSAWVREDQISLGQIKTSEKSNEITAIPELIESIDIRGSVVTIDAMGCQKEIVRKIIEREGHYVLAVKENHPTLYGEVEEYFEWARKDRVEKTRLSCHEEVGFEHGKVVKWKVFSTKDTVWFENKQDWAQLRSFVMVECEREVKGEIRQQRRYYISSLEEEAGSFHRYIRGHWSVENQLHWRLDVAFHEDACKIHKDYAPENLSLLRKMALAMIIRDSSRKGGVARKRKMAGWDNDYAFHVVFAEV